MRTGEFFKLTFLCEFKKSVDKRMVVVYNNYCRWEMKATISASGSVGRAQPCQGWGRGFESRLALFCL